MFFAFSIGPTYILSTNYVKGIIIGYGDKAENKIENLCLWRTEILVILTLKMGEWVWKFEGIEENLQQACLRTRVISSPNTWLLAVDSGLLCCQ